MKLHIISFFVFLGLLITSSPHIYAQVEVEGENEAGVPIKQQKAYLRQQLFLEPRARSEGGYRLDECLNALEKENILREGRMSAGGDQTASAFNPAWTFMGPKPVSGSFGNVAGRIKTIAVDPNGTTLFIVQQTAAYGNQPTAVRTSFRSVIVFLRFRWALSQFHRSTIALSMQAPVS